MTLLRADARSIPLADETVDLVVTSPPYYDLRSYTDDGQHVDGQLGDEPTPGEFVDSLLDVMAELVRVTRPAGSIFINLGDKYAGGTGNGKPHTGTANIASNGQTRNTIYSGAPTRDRSGIPAKSLMGIPWRFAIRAMDELGLILRAEVVWNKTNGLPESVTDRVRRSHEQIFHFTKTGTYFSAVDEIREPHRKPLDAAGMASRLVGDRNGVRHSRNTGSARADGRDGFDEWPDDCTGSNPLGKTPVSVWDVSTDPLIVPDHLPQHFAAFPAELPRRIILGWSPRSVCLECGDGRAPIIVRTFDGEPNALEAARQRERSTQSGGTENVTLGRTEDVRREIIGYSCSCSSSSAPTRPAVVLDPFVGTGTTVGVANALGRTGLGLDLSADYLRLAEWRVADPGLRAKALGVDKPKPELSGQLDLGLLR